MDTKFINDIIISYNQLTSDLDSNQVGVGSLQNDDRVTIILGAESSNRLAATIIINGGPIFSFSDTNPRAIAERLDKALDDFNTIAIGIDEANVSFGDTFRHHISIAFDCVMTKLLESER